MTQIAQMITTIKIELASQDIQHHRDTAQHIWNRQCLRAVLHVWHCSEAFLVREFGIELNDGRLLFGLSLFALQKHRVQCHRALEFISAQRRYRLDNLQGTSAYTSQDVLVAYARWALERRLHPTAARRRIETDGLEVCSVLLFHPLICFNNRQQLREIVSVAATNWDWCPSFVSTHDGMSHSTYPHEHIKREEVKVKVEDMQSMDLPGDDGSMIQPFSSRPSDSASNEVRARAASRQRTLSSTTTLTANQASLVTPPSVSGRSSSSPLSSSVIARTRTSLRLASRRERRAGDRSVPIDNRSGLAVSRHLQLKGGH